MTIKQKNNEDEGEEKQRWGGTFQKKNWDEEEEQL